MGVTKKNFGTTSVPMFYNSPFFQTGKRALFCSQKKCFGHFHCQFLLEWTQGTDSLRELWLTQKTRKSNERKFGKWIFHTILRERKNFQAKSKKLLCQEKVTHTLKNQNVLNNLFSIQIVCAYNFCYDGFHQQTSLFCINKLLKVLYINKQKSLGEYKWNIKLTTNFSKFYQ